MATGNGEDFYVLLGVSPLASFEEVKEAYRRQALLCHPDKNRDKNATEQFQRLAQAWETLRDPQRRREYDLKVLKHWRNNVEYEVRRQWQSSGHENTIESFARIEKGKNFRNSIQQKYAERLQNWEQYLQRQWIAIKHYQVLVRRYEKQMDDQMKESHETMLQKFNAAISLSEAKGTHFSDHGAVIEKLVDARRIYLLNLKLAGQATRGRLQYLLEELATATRTFEEEEYQHRQAYGRDALELLETDCGTTPLFTIIDRRQQAINHWKALLRIKNSISSGPIQCVAGTWHEETSWPRVAGEHICTRCKSSAFHIIPGMSAASCPGCRSIVCANCYHDLKILRDLHRWLQRSEDHEASLFSLEFKGGSEPVSRSDNTA